MPHGAMAGYVWAIEPTALHKHAPAAYKEFDDFVTTREIDLDTFGQTLDQDDNTPFYEYLTSDYGLGLDAEEGMKVYDRVWTLYQAVVHSFWNNTKCTIELTTVDDGDGDNGSPYNEVSGPVWVIDACVMRPEVEALGQGVVDQKFYCVYG